MIAKIRWGLALGLPVVAFGLWGFLVAQEPLRAGSFAASVNTQSTKNQPSQEARPQGSRDRKGSGGAGEYKARPQGYGFGGAKAGPGGRPDFKGGSRGDKAGSWHGKGHGFPGPMGGPMGVPGMRFAAFKKIEPVQPDKDVAAWIKVLADKMTDRHDQIRESSRKALVDLGASAILPLRELAKSTDTATAIAAKNVLKRIEGPGPDVLKMSPMMQGKAQFQIRIDGNKGGPGSEKKMEVPLPGGGKARIEIYRSESREKKFEVSPKSPDRSREEPKGKDQPKGEFKKDALKGGPPNLEKILGELKLEPEKRKKVEDIFFSHQQRMREFMEKNRDVSAEDRQKLFPQVREMQEGLMKALREILSEDQLKSLRGGLPGFGSPFNKGEKARPGN